jgi:hypothetical protein
MRSVAAKPDSSERAKQVFCGVFAVRLVQVATAVTMEKGSVMLNFGMETEQTPEGPKQVPLPMLVSARLPDGESLVQYCLAGKVEHDDVRPSLLS